MTFNGETRTGTGETFTQTFKAPEVTKPTVFKLTSVGTGDAGTCSRSVNITVLPSGTTVVPPDDELPNTGGPRLILLIARSRPGRRSEPCAIRMSRKERSGRHAH